MSERTRPGEPIAIIGMAGRFPGAENLDEFWRNLADGVDSIRTVPPDRWDVDAFYDRDAAAPGKMVTRWGGFLDQVDGFDPDFFGISRREAERMDPQQRLALEVAWEALEDAGLPRERVAGTQTSVFMGVTHYDHAFFGFQDAEGIGGYDLTGTLLYSVPARISYFLDLHGPSVALDAACSASLAAVHLACQSLRLGESDLAMAGGVNLILHPAFTIAFTKSGAMSPQGRCRTFDAGADGFVRGEGAGVVVLKRLSDALRDRDPVRAVVRGSAVRHGGHSPGYTIPNGKEQEQLMRAALADAGLHATDVGCVEPHATGTIVGDPIELQALAAVYGTPAPEAAPCVLSSAKTNIGHLEAAAGIAGLIKGVLSLEKELVPPVLHFQRLNPAVSFEGTRLAIAARPQPWMRGDRPRNAAISSFGIAGNIAHVILGEAPTVTRQEVVPDQELWLALSARSPQALQVLARRFREWLATSASAPLRDVCYTAGARRTHLAQRVAVPFRRRAELLEGLHAVERGDAIAVPERSWADRYVQGETIPWDELFPNATSTPIPGHAWQRESFRLAGGRATPWLQSRATPAVPEPVVSTGIRGTLLARESGERAALLEAWLRETIGRALLLPSPRVDPDTPVADLGVDSLMAVEIGARIEEELGLKISAVGLLSGSTVSTLTRNLLARLAEKP